MGALGRGALDRTESANRTPRLNVVGVLWFDFRQVDQRGRYLNLPVSRLETLRALAHGDFAIRIRELHTRAKLSSASGQVPSRPRRYPFVNHTDAIP